MLEQLTWDVAATVALAGLVGFLLTSFARRVACRVGMLDRPDNVRKGHGQPTPLLGGVAIYGALLTALGVAWITRQSWLVDNPRIGNCTAMLLVSGGLYCLIGLWDDARELRPRTKFLLQIFASLPFVFWCRSIESIQLLGTECVLGAFGALFTIFWLVGCANVINLVDGMDGLAGTVGLIVCLAVAAQAGLQDLAGVVPLALIVAGGIVGFLQHNWPPARIFLGDSGSLLIGFLVGVLSIEGSLKTATGFAMAVPLVLVSVPVFDTFMAIVRRKLRGQGIGQADRRHIHHRLQDRGLSRFRSLLVIAGLCVAMAAAALTSVYFEMDWPALGICGLLLVLLIVGRVFGYDETLLVFRYLRVVSSFLAESSGALRTRLWIERVVHVETDTPQELWRRVIRQVEVHGGVELEFHFSDERSTTPLIRLNWASQAPVPLGGSMWEVSYSVPHQPGMQLQLRASGRSGPKSSGALPDELLRTFQAFCRRWPADAHEDRALTDELGATIAAPEPAAEELTHRRAA